jgi:hypothetical protein
MIIFDLDGTLADCEHRKHYILATQSKEHLAFHENKWWHVDENHQPTKKWHPDWQAFYEACDKDEPIKPVLDAFIHLTQGEPFNHDVQVWSGRCESVRKKTLNWLVNLTGYLEDKMYWDRRLKMRPVGDSTPDEELKERWLDEAIAEGKTIDFVFDDRPKVVRFWRRRGIFVFNCCQHDEEF